MIFYKIFQEVVSHLSQLLHYKMVKNNFLALYPKQCDITTLLNCTWSADTIYTKTNWRNHQDFFSIHHFSQSQFYPKTYLWLFWNAETNMYCWSSQRAQICDFKLFTIIVLQIPMQSVRRGVPLYRGVLLRSGPRVILGWKTQKWLNGVNFDCFVTVLPYTWWKSKGATSFFCKNSEKHHISCFLSHTNFCIFPVFSWFAAIYVVRNSLWINKKVIFYTPIPKKVLLFGFVKYLQSYLRKSDSVPFFQNG